MCPLLSKKARPLSTPQPEAATDLVQDACVCDEDEAVHNPAVKSGSDHSFCPDLVASQTDSIPDDDLSFEEACPPTPVSCPRCDEGGRTGFVVQASSPTTVPALSEVVFPGRVRLKNEIAYPKDIGFFSPSPLLQQRLGLAAASSLSRPSPDGTVPIRLLNTRVTR